MNCESFLKLDNFEQSLYIGKLIHACQSDNELFAQGERLIESAKQKGLFERVKIYPNHQTNFADDTDKLPPQQREKA